MKKLLFALPGNENLTANLAELSNAETGKLKFHQFPDGESFIQILSEVAGREIVFVCTLNQPDAKFLPLYFLAKELRKCGAAKIILVAPYLAYMRQDKAFHPGEIVTSTYFGELISGLVDALMTVDPHLHRWKNLTEIYAIPCQVLHASTAIATYIKAQIPKPLLIGPDSESQQWVSEVAGLAEAPFITLEKTRHSDKHVEISIPDLIKYQDLTPVLLDDIISTAHTMIEAVNKIKNAASRPVICIGIHALFAENAYEELTQTGAEIITCNTIEHISNKIDLTELLAEAIK